MAEADGGHHAHRRPHRRGPWHGLRGKVEAGGCALAGFAVLYGGLSAAALHTAWLPKYEKEKSIPYLHWVMMGLYDDGGYNDDAYKLTLQGETYEERLEIDKKEIARKVREMGPAGLAAHAANKLIFTFGEGMYHAPIKLDLGAVHQNPLQMYFIQGKQHLGRTAYATLAVQLALLAGLCMAAAVRHAFGHMGQQWRGWPCLGCCCFCFCGRRAAVT